MLAVLVVMGIGWHMNRTCFSFGVRIHGLLFEGKERHGRVYLPLVFDSYTGYTMNAYEYRCRGRDHRVWVGHL